jgi:type III secretory pathway component EscV
MAKVKSLKDMANIGTLVSDGLFANFPFVAFLFFLALVYIANAHFANKQVIQIHRLERDIKELKWKYNATKSDLMLNSKQSEVEKAVSPFGLKLSNQRTKRIPSSN